jgi:hypothetical protein
VPQEKKKNKKQKNLQVDNAFVSLKSPTVLNKHLQAKKEKKNYVQSAYQTIR